MLIGFERIPIRTFYLLPGLGAAIITVVVYSGGANAAAAYGGYYFWAVFAAFFFLDFWRAVPTLAIAVAGYGAALLAQGDAADPALNWVMAAGTLTVAGVLISLLRQRSERLVALLGEAQGVAHIGSWEWHVPSDEVAWSRELYRLYGLRPGGFPANYEGLLSYVHPEDRDAVDRTLRRALVDHAPFSFEHRVVRHDGATRIVHGRGQVETDDSGNPVRIFGTAQDVTDQTAHPGAVPRAGGVGAGRDGDRERAGNDRARQRSGGEAVRVRPRRARRSRGRDPRAGALPQLPSRSPGRLLPWIRRPGRWARGSTSGA